MTDTAYIAPARLPPATLAAACDAAARAIPPAWPLAATVAVNPFLGQTGETLAQVSARLGRTAGTAVTMPRDWYASRIANGTITEEDLAGALAAATPVPDGTDVEALKAAARSEVPTATALPTVADLAAKVSGIDWPGVIADRFGAFASGYCDEGQALWAASRGRNAYAAWRAVATHDLTPEILGLRGFGQHAADAPQTAEDGIAQATGQLGLTEAALETYLHQLLLTLGGWSQLARYQSWQAELAGGSDCTITDFLAIRLLWEEALFCLYKDQIAEDWADIVAAHETPCAPSAAQQIDSILQEAAERAAQRDLAETLCASSVTAISANERPDIQAAFCIDVRSEVFRRALESVHPGIQTLGFAGFFGLTVAHRSFASDVVEHRLPVLLNAGLTSTSCGKSEADQSARFKARAKRAWGRFKIAAVSSFAFVEATGPVHGVNLLRDALGRAGTAPQPDPMPRLDPMPDLATRIDAAERILRAMSLTENFARVVLLAGHGAKVKNNPHASALHCGACGGHAGDINARLLASLLNDPDTRSGLAAKGIKVPADTLFVGALHDTTTDAVTVFDTDTKSEEHAQDLRALAGWLDAAGTLARSERALRLPRANSAADIAERSRNWAETRPEWGLAGCKGFIAAPRRRTAGKSLAGRAFLHDYDWHQDKDFSVLELILTAPAVVASWISLQYFGSTVAPGLFGGGNKLLHNVTGGIGVVEGNGGTLRVGLPWQSVHDGQNYIHDPLRLSVCVEAPREAISAVLARHDAVRALFDNRWMHLFAMDAEGKLAWRYVGDGAWQAEPGPDTQTPELAKAS
ncbi:YbcC family protein [Meridianimarinicoccus aquatilis]|uniref:Probable inorganic carbon transporter subunit DabA n=1 Tax=Meridianimarinicoccus aquatilis TaxID=2552766 RepID=A0A4V3BBP9_9RHOB|nr:DUF2309 domain-containing protein [Fluviibacterium aquatile]TDL87979.1 DUF2309 domain-containing protein [Fluviibacterium aquatile]